MHNVSEWPKWQPVEQPRCRPTIVRRHRFGCHLQITTPAARTPHLDSVTPSPGFRVNLCGGLRRAEIDIDPLYPAT